MNAEIALALESAASAEDLRMRAATAEARLESAAREGARAAARAQAETSEWRAKCVAQEKELAVLRLETVKASSETVAAARAAFSSRDDDDCFSSSSPAKENARPSDANIRETTSGISMDGDFSFSRQPPMPPPPSYAKFRPSSSPGGGGAASAGATRPGSAAATPGGRGSLLTAEFLDSLRGRLSTVRDLLESPAGGGGGGGGGEASDAKRYPDVYP